MDFDDFSGPIDLHAENRWEAIDELAGHLVAAHKVPAEHRGAIIASVRLRESAMSTGIGSGIGLPHATTDLLQEVVGVVGRSRRGIQFDAPDGQPVNLVILFLIPLGQPEKHVHTLANIAKMLHQDDFRHGLRRRFL
jgi:mannitol/fructose-specific phosphotransferase system IIA component (Ntr-type)